LSSTLFNIHIWLYNSVNTAIYLSQRKTTANVLQVVSLYVRWIQRYLIRKDLPVLLVYSSWIRTANICVREIFSSIINHQRWYNTGTCGYITSRRYDNCQYVARWTKPVLPAHEYSWTPACYSTHQPDMCLQRTEHISYDTRINAEHDTPHIFLPDKVPIISQHEPYQLQERKMPTLQTLENPVSPRNTSTCNRCRFLVARGVTLRENNKLKYAGTRLFLSWLLIFCY
jgi:hypothetical protein